MPMSAQESARPGDSAGAQKRETPGGVRDAARGLEWVAITLGVGDRAGAVPAPGNHGAAASAASTRYVAAVAAHDGEANLRALPAYLLSRRRVPMKSTL